MHPGGRGRASAGFLDAAARRRGRSSDRPRPRLVAICADVRDPGNAGTVIRCADAAGADAVVLAGDSVDAYNPKTVRASVGSLFHVPFAIERDAAAAVARAPAPGSPCSPPTAGERSTCSRPTTCSPGRPPGCSATRRGGCRPTLAALADHRVRIPIHGRAESLNLATAAALCLYASARTQRS